MRRTPFLMCKKPYQDRDGDSGAPHQDDPKPPLIVHILDKGSPSVIQIFVDEYRDIEDQSARLKERAYEVAFRDQEHKKRQPDRHQKEEDLLHR